MILDWLLEKTAPWWIRQIQRRERALLVLENIYQEGQHGEGQKR